MSTPEIEFRPRPLSHRTWIRLGLVAIVVAVLYALVAYFYNSEGGYTVSGDGESESQDMSVTIDPLDLYAQTNTLTAQLSFHALGGDLFDAQGHLTKNLRVQVDNVNGTKELKFPVGTIPGVSSVDLALTGELAQYPFDQHEGGLFISAETYEKNPDGTITSTGTILPGVSVSSGVNGWDTAAQLNQTAASSSAAFTFNRAFSTQVFALMLLALAVMLAAATVIVAFLVASQRRRAEIGLMSWTAALLFALPALRTFMPNSPPIGAAIDMYVYLWVMAGAIIAAVIMIVSWVRQSGRMLQADPTAQGGGVPRVPDVVSTDMSGD